MTKREDVHTCRNANILSCSGVIRKENQLSHSVALRSPARFVQREDFN
jgi:hypothetical protein